VVLGETGGSVASDVYSLGATLWHLLIGQSPFRVNDGDNSRPALEARICAGGLPPMPRPDVPRALSDLLTGMMATTWYARPSLTDVIRDLAAVGGGPAAQFAPPTQYSGPGGQPGFPPAATRGTDDADRTSVRRPAGNQADPTVAPHRRPGEEPRPGTNDSGSSSGNGRGGADNTGPDNSGRNTGDNGRRTLSYGDDGGAATDTDHPIDYGSGYNRGYGDGYNGGRLANPYQQNIDPVYGSAPAAHPNGQGTGDVGIAEDHDADESPGRRRWVLPGTIGAAVLAAALGFAVFGGAGGKPNPGPATPSANPGQQQQDPGQLGQNEPPGPVAVTAARVGPLSVQFSWTYSDELANDSFQWQTSDGSQSGVVKVPTLDLQDQPGVQLCIQVKVVRADGSNGSVDWSQPGCSQ